MNKRYNKSEEALTFLLIIVLVEKENDLLLIFMLFLETNNEKSVKY